ncbi:MAG: methionine--tRNA ligase [Gammaproteobacteria bacterium]|nr:methionine--tRNA ligase [Gammaproteobacteria bacterium]
MPARQILMTIALPYANGEIHLGHLVEAIQADIWARFQRLRGHNCVFVCGSDAHGTSIMLSAEDRGISPEKLIEEIRGRHTEDFQNFLIGFDNFYTTHSEENKQLSADIYQKLKNRGDINTREITQAFDPEKNIFLADRFIRGECPRCNEADQYGDNCEKCGATYSPAELKNSTSVLSGAKPIEKQSLHYFFELKNYETLLKDWINAEHLQPEVANKLKEWFKDGLRAWDISRDAPYFGFEIPDAPGKYFYVWLDAPVGYMASLQDLCKRRKDLNFATYWDKDSKAELYHFIGKDITYFHALFWPAMLAGSDFRLPTAIFVHGFLTINGQKMSKSRGVFVTARDYLKHFKPEYLRYYFAAKLTNEIQDIDLNLEDFMHRVNSDLVGKFVNLASRCAGFITKKFNGKLAANLTNPTLQTEFINTADKIAELYEALNYNQAMREIMRLADLANQYIDREEPWKKAKQDGLENEVHGICTQGLNLFRLLAIYLKPVLPDTAKNIESFLNINELTWSDLNTPLLDHEINKFKPLMQRIDSDAIVALNA